MRHHRGHLVAVIILHVVEVHLEIECDRMTIVNNLNRHFVAVVEHGKHRKHGDDHEVKTTKILNRMTSRQRLRMVQRRGRLVVDKHDEVEVVLSNSELNLVINGTQMKIDLVNQVVLNQINNVVGVTPCPIGI